MSFHEFKGQRVGAPTQNRGFSQATTRHTIHLFDQDGRKWWASAENNSGMPTGRISPSFKAPWFPDHQYLIPNPDNASELYVDYPAMFRDRRGSLKEYHKDAVRLATEKSWTLPEFGKYSSAITDKLGKPPRAIELIVAAGQGNPWVLGQSTVPDPRLVPFLERTTTDLLGTEGEYDFSAASYAREVSGVAVVASPATDFAFYAAADDASIDEDLDGLSLDADQEPTEPSNTEPDPLDEPLMDDDEGDPEALGGRTVAPRNAEKAARQVPRRPGTKVRASKPLKPFQREGRRSMADGAVPVIGE